MGSGGSKKPAEPQPVETPVDEGARSAGNQERRNISRLNKLRSDEEKPQVGANRLLG